MSAPLKGYKKRLHNRRILAHKIGPSAFYQAKSGRLPRPLFTLLKMLKGWRIRHDDSNQSSR